ncbi:hypothetical protein BJ322DRAFT_137345 [Thelephora terrestris]|uniref:Uncharacterized protein n=1 Tax=Thelephora terrestris TaxID=56493 RepID=A0A9P6HAV0_9AGAM|nr:hypothetical protein BJ322DRAFT_137345 [Thelephora terrestris]
MEKTQIFDGQVTAGHPINSGPSSRTYKRIRFTDVVIGDVYVYVSIPSSQKRGRLLRISSTAAEPRDVHVMSLVTHNGPLPSRSAIEDAKETVAEGRTSQDILRGYFPSAPSYEVRSHWLFASSSCSSCLRTLRALVDETFRETMFVCLCGSPKFSKRVGFLELLQRLMSQRRA